MPKMKPLEEWTCDTCRQVVSSSDGALEWLSPSGKGPHSFRIVHNSDRCYRHTNAYDRADIPLSEFLGAKGLQNFLSMLSVGPILDPKEKGEPIPHIPSFVDTVRRLQIPFYEEARHYFSEATADGYFTDQNEVSIFLPGTCEAIIRRYEK